MQWLAAPASLRVKAPLESFASFAFCIYDGAMQKNLALTQELAAIVEPQPNECFRNSVLALAAYHGDAEARYVEGWFDIFGGSGWLTEHGWLEIGGELVDVTVDDVEAAHYYPVFYYTMDEVAVHVSKERWLPYFGNHRHHRRKMMEVYAWARRLEFEP